MTKRDEFIAGLKAQLDELSAELHRLEARMAKTGTGVSDRYRHAVAELRGKRDAAEEKLEALRDAGEEGWDALRHDAEKTWTAFKAGLDLLRDFSDHA